MENNQITINAINCLSGTIDALNRAGKEDAISVIVKKILELVKTLD